jgi:hypothetical protein
VSGLKSAHGLRHAGENGLLARQPTEHGKTSPARPGGPPAARVPRAGRGHRAARVPGPVRWRVGRGLAGGRGAARCSAPAPPLRGGCAGQREWRRGSPRRSGGGGVAGSGRRGGVLMEGGSSRVAASSRAVLWLET